MLVIPTIVEVAIALQRDALSDGQGHIIGGIIAVVLIGIDTATGFIDGSAGIGGDGINAGGVTDTGAPITSPEIEAAVTGIERHAIGKLQAIVDVKTAT